MRGEPSDAASVRSRTSPEQQTRPVSATLLLVPASFDTLTTRVHLELTVTHELHRLDADGHGYEEDQEDATPIHSQVPPCCSISPRPEVAAFVARMATSHLVTIDIVTDRLEAAFAKVCARAFVFAAVPTPLPYQPCAPMFTLTCARLLHKDPLRNPELEAVEVSMAVAMFAQWPEGSRDARGQPRGVVSFQGLYHTRSSTRVHASPDRLENTEGGGVRHRSPGRRKQKEPDKTPDEVTADLSATILFDVDSAYDAPAYEHAEQCYVVSPGPSSPVTRRRGRGDFVVATTDPTDGAQYIDGVYSSASSDGFASPCHGQHALRGSGAYRKR